MSDEPAYLIRLDGESTGPEGRYLVWHYRDGSLEIEPEDSLQLALQTAHTWDDYEYGRFEFIEGPAGIVPQQEIDAWIGAADKRSYARYRAAQADMTGKLQYHVAVKHPTEEMTGEWECTFDEDEARRAAADLNLPGRVQIYSTVYGAAWNEDTKRVIKDWNDPL
jgi:hypothetical protein